MTQDEHEKETRSDGSGVRLDRWLFSVRIFKTRSMAAKACAGGKVKVNGVACKAHKEVRVGDEIALRREGRRLSYIIRGLTDRRLGAAEAAKLFDFEEDAGMTQDMKAALKMARQSQAMVPRPKGRPSKRDRRQLEKFKKSTD